MIKAPLYLARKSRPIKGSNPERASERARQRGGGGNGGGGGARHGMAETIAREVVTSLARSLALSRAISRALSRPVSLALPLARAVSRPQSRYLSLDIFSSLSLYQHVCRNVVFQAGCESILHSLLAIEGLRSDPPPDSWTGPSRDSRRSVEDPILPVILRLVEGLREAVRAGGGRLVCWGVGG